MASVAGSRGSKAPPAILLLLLVAAVVGEMIVSSWELRDAPPAVQWAQIVGLAALAALAAATGVLALRR